MLYVKEDRHRNVMPQINGPFSLNSYDYYLPKDLIAQHPLKDRSASRLMILKRDTGQIIHSSFSRIPEFVSKNDCLVLNDSKVFPARLLGRKEKTQGRVELLLLQLPEILKPGRALATALYRSSKPLKSTAHILLDHGLTAVVKDVYPGGRALVELSYPETEDLLKILHSCGKVPLPPYIRRELVPEDQGRYQTVYAKKPGSVAAPTAGLHFTPELLKKLRRKGVRTAWVTLHVGYGTFSPIRTNDIRQYRIHSEWLSVPIETVETLKKTRQEGGRIIAVGTTSVRSLETCADETGKPSPFEGWCDLYIYPGYRFKLVDAMITNFHLPKSSLLLLVSAFAGREKILSAYREAVSKGYRFFSYGDAMFIT